MFLLYFCCPFQSHSILFDTLWFYSIHIGLIWSYSVHFGSIQSILSTLVLFGPLLSTCFFFQLTLVLFGPFHTLRSYSVHIICFAQLQSYLVHFGSIQSILNSVLFGLIWSYTVHFGSIRSILILFSSH